MVRPRIDPIRWQPPPSRPLPDPDLTSTLHVVELPGTAPEDVVADAEGNVWTGVEDGRIVRVTPDGSSAQVVTNTGGRPLGLAVARDGRLLICDSHRGLLRYDPATETLETLVAEVAGRALTFCSNVVESSAGDPGGSVSVLASNLYFANGVTLTADESALVFAETTACRLSKYWLTGDQAGSITSLAIDLPG